VRWRGWLDLERLEGAGCLQLDEELAAREEALLTRHIQLVHQKIRDCEDRYRSATDIQVTHALQQYTALSRMVYNVYVCLSIYGCSLC
jgi:predicted component of type VI protein secretion system